MITIDSDPKLNPINIGASILNSMARSEYSELEVGFLYEVVRAEFNASYDVFVYTLDWLFIVGAVTMNSEGRVEYAVN